MKYFATLLLMLPALGFALAADTHEHDGEHDDVQLIHKRQANTIAGGGGSTTPKVSPFGKDCDPAATAPYTIMNIQAKTFVQSTGGKWDGSQQQIFFKGNDTQTVKRFNVYEGEPDKNHLIVGPASAETDPYKRYALKAGKLVYSVSVRTDLA